MSEELKPCPICGGKAHIMWEDRPVVCWVGCERNGCVATDTHPDEEDAIAVWNRRTPSEQPAPASTGRETYYIGSDELAKLRDPRYSGVAAFLGKNPSAGRTPLYAEPVAARELDVEAERQEPPSKMLDAQLRYIFELEQKVVALEAQVAAQPESAQVSTARLLANAEDKLHALHAEADEIGSALDRDIARYGTGGAQVSTEQAGDAWPNQAAFEAQARYQGATDFTLVHPDFMVCNNGWTPATYRNPMTELAWRVWANKRAPSPNNSPVGADKEPNNERDL